MAPKSEEQFEAIRQERVSNILNAALQLFAEQGIDNTSISAIAREAGISKGLIYNYFSSKDELLEKLLRQGFEVFEKFLGDLDHEDEHFLIVLLRKYKDSLQHNTRFWKLYGTLSMRLYHRGEVFQHMLQEMRNWRHYIDEVFRDAGFAKPEIMSWRLMAFLDGVALYYLTFDDYPVDEVIDAEIEYYKTLIA